MIRSEKNYVDAHTLGLFLTAIGRQLAAEASRAVTTADAQMLRDFTRENAIEFRDSIRRALLTLNPSALDRSSIRVS
jgi:DNA-binding MarR family transcriptional regulator